MHSRQTLAVIFWISKNRIKNGKAPVWMRITVNGKRVELSAQREVIAEEWNPAFQMSTGKSPDAKEINGHLWALKLKLFNCQSRIESRNEIVTADKLKAEFLGVKEKPRMLVPIFSQHNEDIKSLIGNGYSLGTYKKFKNILKHVVEFLAFKHNVPDINIKSINLEFIFDFEFYLKAQKKINLNSTAKYMRGFKKIMTACVNKDWLDKNPFSGYKFKMKIVDREFLSQIELDEMRKNVFLQIVLTRSKMFSFFVVIQASLILMYINLRKIILLSASMEKNGSLPIVRKQMQPPGSPCFHLRWPYSKNIPPIHMC